MPNKMKKPVDVDPRVAETMERVQRTWLMWGVLPLVVAAMLMFAVSAVWASPSTADAHDVERGFHAVLAVCAALFLAGFWLDGRWANSERLALRIWQAAGGEEFTPTRSQLAAQADLAFRSITSSANILAALGGAMAVAAVLSVGAGLGLGEGVQIILMGLCYQIFLFSRHPFYREILEAAARGELVVPAEDLNNQSA